MRKNEKCRKGRKMKKISGKCWRIPRRITGETGDAFTAENQVSLF
jgi:hypothetical protein